MVVQVRREGGFDGPVTLVTDATYFDRFDFNQHYPEPASVASRGEEVLYVFEQIEGEVLRVAFDGRASPTFVFALAWVDRPRGGGSGDRARRLHHGGDALMEIVLRSAACSSSCGS